MKTRAPSFSASEVRFALASYCKCLTSHLPRCALVHAHIGQLHAPATLRATHAPAQIHAPKRHWGYLHSHPSQDAHVRAHSHAPYSLSDRIFIEQEQPKAAHNIFRLRGWGAKPALIPQPMWLMYHVRS
jgi:hypothetical protein